MAKVVVKSKVKKVKRKFPVKFVAPEYLNSKNLGESQVTDLTSLVGKTLKINLMYISNNIKNQNVRLEFKVIDVASGLAKTQVSSYTQIPYYLGRFVKKSSDLVETSVVFTSKNGVKLRVKPFIVTKTNVSSMILTTLRIKVTKMINDEISSHSADEFMSSVISNKLQNLFRNELKKVSPIKVFEFKKVEFEN